MLQGLTLTLSPSLPPPCFINSAILDGGKRPGCETGICTFDFPPIETVPVGNGLIDIGYAFNIWFADSKGNIVVAANWPITATLSSPDWRGGASYSAPRDLPGPRPEGVLQPQSLESLVTARVSVLVLDSFLAAVWYLVWPTIANQTTAELATPFLCNLAAAPVPSDDCPFPPVVRHEKRLSGTGVILQFVFKGALFRSPTGHSVFQSIIGRRALYAASRSLGLSIRIYLQLTPPPLLCRCGSLPGQLQVPGRLDLVFLGPADAIFLCLPRDRVAVWKHLCFVDCQRVHQCPSRGRPEAPAQPHGAPNRCGLRSNLRRCWHRERLVALAYPCWQVA